MDTLLQDIRYAVRQLLRTPSFTVVATLTLALGIGATTAIYSVVDAVLVRPLPFKDPGQLVRVGSTDRDGAIADASPLDLADFRTQSHSLAGLVPIKEVTSVSMQRAGHETERLTWSRVGAGFFSLLGVPAQLGRTFATGDDAPGAPTVAILSDATWRRYFGADPHVIGREIRLSDKPYTVVGVAPAWFTFPDTPNLWVPYVFAPFEIAPGGRSLHEIFALGRLRAGVTVETARRDLQTIARRLAQQYPESNTGYGASLEPLKGQMVDQARQALLAMLGAVVLVLCIACANVANLLLVRATARQTEIAVRTALGASRRRVIHQLLTESALLSIAGFGVGTLFALWTVHAVVAFGPRGLPRLDEISVNLRVLLCTAGVAIGTGMLFGLVPALHATRTDLASSLRQAGPRAGRGSGKRTRSVLVVAELALAVVLLVGAGLLARSFARLVQVDPGFRADHVLAFDVTLPVLPHDAQRNAFTNTLIERLRALPGTEDVGVAGARPFETMRNFSISTSFSVVGQPPAPRGKEPDTELLPVSSGYFRALGVPLIGGRTFTEGESRWDVPPVVVVNQAFVRRYFPNESPLGKQIVLGITHDTGATEADTATSRGEIVGVVGDVKELSLADAVGPRTYVPYSTLPFSMSVVIRASANPAPLFRAIRSVVRDIDPNIAVYDLTTLDGALDTSVAQPRFYAVLLGGFAVIALVLAALGIYGVISYAVSQRTGEFGIRMALGATPGRLLRLVLGGGMTLTAAGVALGLLGAIGLTRVISSLLFGIEPIDLLTYTGVVAALFGVAILACWVPARRAARVDSAIAMRAE
jgi:predicted permease